MKRRLSNERGQAMVEFVIVLPLIFGLVFLIFYAGIAFNRYLAVTDAARVGARAAAVARFHDQAPCDAATDAAKASAGNLAITVDCPDPPPWNSGNPFTVTVTYSLGGLDFLWLHVGSKTITSSVKERLE